MATQATGARASRRAAATAARSNLGATQKPEAPDVLADVMETEEDIDMQAAADEAFGPDDVSSAATEPSIGQIVDDVRKGNGIVVQSSVGALTLPQEDLTRKIDVGDLIIPKLRLSQAMSKTNTVFTTSKGGSGVQQGNWYVSTANENLGETVFFIPVDMRKSRAYFMAGQGLMCRSFDLLNGEGDPGGACEGSLEERHTLPADKRGCPLRLWIDNSPPKCGQTYNYPGLVIRESEIEDPKNAKPIQAILQLRSTATKAAKAINTFVMNEGGGVWSNTILELSVEVQSNPRGTFYVPTVDFYDTADAEGFERIARRAASMARQMGNQNLRASIEDDGTA